MTSRPSLISKRPLSAIFLGSVSTSSSHIPDLPDPPSSPVTTSGLPSPPATNSTSSGSTGDGPTNAGSVRRSSTSSQNVNMHNGSTASLNLNSPPQTSRRSYEEVDEDNDEDHTAKLSDGRRLPLKSPPSENASALQRVKSLTQRNRMVLDKLASYSSGSRLSTPSPPNVLRNSRTPAPQSAPSVASSSRMSLTESRRDRSNSAAALSGSETERENASATHYSSDDQSSSPSTTTVPFRSRSVRERRISAPSSPGKFQTTRALQLDRSASPASVLRPPVSPRKRVSMTALEGNVDVTAAALAAVANSRRSPIGGKRRQPLPREFRDGIADGSAVTEPSTPHRHSERSISPTSHTGRTSPSPRSRAITMLNHSPQSPRPRPQRYSTVRDMTRRHQTRHLTQDLSLTPDNMVDEDEGRKQNRRGGSDDIVLGTAGARMRSVVNQSLRAAGLAKKRDGGDDVFSGESGESELQTARRIRLSGGLGTRPSLVDGGRDGPKLKSRSNDGSVYTDGSALGEPHTPATTSQRAAHRHATVFSSRPSTSMAAFHEEPRTAPPLLRSHTSAIPPPERERPASTSLNAMRSSSQSRSQYQAAPQDRSSSSPSTSGRRSTVQSSIGGGSSVTSEHTRLMLSSLSMFESHLARLPSMGTTTTVTIPELFRSAQNIVHSVNSLNTLLRNGTSHALEEQIEAEVGDNDDPVDLAQFWRTVGGEYRESLRVSDELVRTMTGFLLGVGKVLRETTSGIRHSRGSSLDDNVVRRASPDVDISGSKESAEDRRSANGKSNGQVRYSWDLNAADRLDGTRRSASRADNPVSHPFTSLNRLQDQDLNRETDHPERLPKLSISTQRSYTPRDSLEPQKLYVIPSVSDAASPAYEPSPTPAPRQQTAELRRTLPPLAVPPPLSTLPSESLLTRKVSKSTRRSKTSATSNATVRANSIFPSLSTPNPTTAITTTSASASPERPPMRPLRSDSYGSIRGTMPRSTSISGAALAGLQQQYDRDGRQRTISGSSNLDEDRPAPPMSGSETERDTRRAIGSRVRMSLDGNNQNTLQSAPLKKERRRTVTEIFSRG